MTLPPIVGIGLCSGKQVTEHCKWSIVAEGADALTFTTAHDFKGSRGPLRPSRVIQTPLSIFH
jgi:hypothetical protein